MRDAAQSKVNDLERQIANQKNQRLRADHHKDTFIKKLGVDVLGAEKNCNDATAQLDSLFLNKLSEKDKAEMIALRHVSTQVQVTAQRASEFYSEMRRLSSRIDRLKHLLSKPDMHDLSALILKMKSLKLWLQNPELNPFTFFSALTDFEMKEFGIPQVDDSCEVYTEVNKGIAKKLVISG